jgi:1,2-diacylglycerol 3-beta-glucosyltransferase
MSILELLLAAVALPALAAAFYLLGLTLVAARRSPAASAAQNTGVLPRFRVVVPAHNEATGIARTVTSLRALSYPTDRFDVVVVADNCTDGTADIARAAGARVIERIDDTQRGKGYGLAYAFERLLAEPAVAWDAAVVVDADTVVTPQLLGAFAARLAAGEQAVQCTYLPTPPTGRLGVITAVAFTAFHVVRSTARERLGLSAGLRGNGMAFSRTLLGTVPHHAFSRTEDVEFGVQLGLRGIRVAYVADAAVYGDMPEDRRAAAVQRSRWIGGRIEIARRHVPALLRDAVQRRSVLSADLAVDLLVPPLSLLLLAVCAGLVLSLSAAAPLATVLWTVATLSLAVHVLDAARRAGRLGELLLASWSIMPYAVEKTFIALRSFRPGGREWVRTARVGET